MTNKHSILALALSTLIAASAFGCSDDSNEKEGEGIDIVLDSGGGDPTDAGDDTEDATTEPEPDASEPDAAPDMSAVDSGPDGAVCQSKEAPVQLINTCTFEWSDCSDGVAYSFQCNTQNVGGNIFSLCNCFEDGVMDPADKIVDICGLSEWSEVEAIVNEECGWDLR